MVFFTRRILFALMGGTTVRGLENVPKTGPVILAPVHVSYTDPMLVGCTSPRMLRFMAKEELFKGPLGWILRSLRSFPVKRGGNDTGAIRLALKTLQEGGALMLFPEGTRGDGTHLGDLQSGVTLMAKKSGAQVVPVGIGGTFQMLPRHRSRPKRSRLTIVYGKPFSYQDTPDPQAFTERLKQDLLRLSQEAGMPLDLKTAPETADPTPDHRPATET